MLHNGSKAVLKFVTYDRPIGPAITNNPCSQKPPFNVLTSLVPFSPVCASVWCCGIISLYLLLYIIIYFLFTSMTTRAASHAGSWYNASPSILSSDLDKWLAKAAKDSKEMDLPIPGARVIIAP
jgi:hypothetical protein